MDEPDWHDNYSLEFFCNRIYQDIKFEKPQVWLLEKYVGLDPDEQGAEQQGDDCAAAAGT
jgi:hypothetical protein